MDDFDAPEIVHESKACDMRGSVSGVQERQRAAYASQGVDISAKKAQHREPCVICMGAEVDGVLGRLAAPKAKRSCLLNDCRRRRESSWC